MVAFTQAQAHPVIALTALLEPLAHGCRVAVLGDATLPLADALLERGARLVHAYDPDPGRVRQAMAMQASSEGRRPVVAELSEELGVRDGAFELVVLVDLSQFGDPEAELRRARRLAAEHGSVVVISPNPEATRFLLPPSTRASEALGYYEFYDMVSLQFPEVRMLGQAPFVGYSLVDFAEEDPEVSIDTSSLAEPELPEWYVAIGSIRPTEVDAYSIVALPLADVSKSMLSEPVTIPFRRDDRELALTEARARILALTGENDKLRDRAGDYARMERSLEQASMRGAELEQEAHRAREQLRSAQAKPAVPENREREQELRARVAQLESELATARAARQDADKAAAEAGRAHAAGEKLVRQAREAAAEAQKTAEVAAIGVATSEKKSAEEIFLLRSRLREIEAAERAPSPQTLRSEEKEAAEERARKLRSELEAQKAEALALSARLADEKKERNRLEVEARSLASKLQQSGSEVDKDYAGDLTRLEERLLERGHQVAELGRQLRESEELARELLWELQTHRAAAGPSRGGPGAPTGGTTGGTNGGAGGQQKASLIAAAAVENGAAGIATQSALDEDLAERAAKAEADRIAAEWRVAQLSRELRETKRPSPADSSARELNLELALASAQREIAELRQQSLAQPGQAKALSAES